MGKRLGLTGVSVIVIVLAGLGGARHFTEGPADRRSTPAQTVAKRLGTTEVVRTDLSDYLTETGTLGYRKGPALHGFGDGLVTWLPRAGSTVTRGETLFRVDDRPVSLFYGKTPLFRELATVGTVGRDVKVLADNLRALGYRVGDQPAAGTSVTVPSPAPSAAKSSYQVTTTSRDGVFTASLKAAVRQWQSDRGIRPATGTLQFGDVLVLSGRVRIGAVSARLGDAATGDLMSVTSRTKAVSVPIAASQADGIEVGDKVRITLPDNTFTSGTVSAVSANVQPKEGDDPVDGSDQPKVEVTVTVDKPSRTRKIASADVEVRFAGTTRRDVLAVPVGALLALSGGGYAVQVSGGALVPVEVGFFADGMVEITGKGVVEGTSVVTTS